MICEITRYASQGWNDFQLISLNEINGDFSTPVGQLLQ